jgi:CRP/FNR family cyclic AMP-dependent transcriptional regulator
MTGISSVAMLEFDGTCFDAVGPETMAELLLDSRTYEVDAGRLVFPVADASPRVALVLQGMARSFLTAADGRQLTVRYAKRGSLIGKYSNLSGDHAPLAIQALTNCTVLEIDAEAFAQCVATQISVSAAVIRELARRLEDVYATAGDSAFGSIRQRVVRQLLMLAEPATVGPWPCVQVSHQQIADAIGSSREVVARLLGRLRDEGLIQTGQRSIDLLNVDRLAESLNRWQPESPY